MENERSIASKGIPETLLVAALTGGAYWLAFRWEAAYMDAFGLPPELVEVSLRAALVVFLAVSGLLWMIFLIANLVAMSWPKHPAIQEKVFRVGFMLLFPVWHLFNYGFRVQDWIFYVVIFALIAIFEIAWPLLVFRSKPTFRERIIADEVAESAPRERSIAGRILLGFGPAAYGVLLLFLLGGVLASTAGKAKATRQKDFYTFSNDPTLVVIRIYADTVVAVPFNRETKIVEPRMIVRKIGNEALSLVFEEDVGPLSKWKVLIPDENDETSKPTEKPNKKIQPTANDSGG